MIKILHLLFLSLVLMTTACNVPASWVRKKQSDETRRICDVYGKFTECFKKIFPLGSSALKSHKFLVDAGFEDFGVRDGTRCREYLREANNLTPANIWVLISEKNNKIEYIYFRGLDYGENLC